MYFALYHSPAHVTGLQTVRALSTRAVAAQKRNVASPFHADAAEKLVLQILNLQKNNSKIEKLEKILEMGYYKTAGNDLQLQLFELLSGLDVDVCPWLPRLSLHGHLHLRNILIIIFIIMTNDQ